MHSLSKVMVVIVWVLIGVMPPFALLDRGYAQQGSRPITMEAAHYYALAGFYQITTGALIWVPAPGYYHGVPAQYVARPQSPAWQPAHPAPAPDRGVRPSGVRKAPDTIDKELYWRPRAMATMRNPIRPGSGRR